MLIFIDESGIHRPVGKSTFVLVYVEVDRYDSFSTAFIQIEQDLGIKYFHWAEAAWPVKEKFIQKILDLDFKVKVAVIENPVNPSLEIERVLAHMIIEHNITKIMIDGKKPKWYERKIKKILRDKMMAVKKLKTVRDESEAGIRLADLLAGLARWHFEDVKRDKIEKYYQRLRSKILVVIE